MPARAGPERPPLALAAPVAVAGLLGRSRSDQPSPGAVVPARPERASGLNGAIVVVLALCGIVLLPIWRGGTALEGPPGLLTDAPAGIIAALAGRVTPADRVWNAQRWGSWLEFA